MASITERHNRKERSGAATAEQGSKARGKVQPVTFLGLSLFYLMVL
jgi:hypothetical protein